MEVFDREPSEVRIPRAVLEAMAAALSVRTVAMRTWPDGIEWMYPLGTWDEPHLEGFAGPSLRGRAPVRNRLEGVENAVAPLTCSEASFPAGRQMRGVFAPKAPPVSLALTKAV
ncbi:MULTISPECIES: hypothetical protein [Streptomyces]|uniref:Uncharacterized protein n=1 Tax=Streptomyces fimbriatus TaxID=68197 RepID=A0ABW0DJG0_STRFI